jgi:predicted nucleic acid-binding protein
LKASVYIETSVFSYLTARPNNDLRAMANQSTTLDWWETQRANYNVFVSELVVSEASKGHPEASQRRLTVINEFPLIAISEEARALAQALIENHALPQKAEADAYHVAIAVVHGIEYLLTWNCTHIANAHARPKIEATCRKLGYEPPVICTPPELTED